MELDPRTIEVMDECMVEVLRRKTPAQRLAIGHGMWDMARSMLTGHVKHQHPDWRPEQVQAEVAARMSHGATRTLT